MKQTIRKNVFETNSSSTHTLIIYKDKPNPVIKLSGRVILQNNGYGDEYITPMDRLSYLYTVACLYPDNFENLMSQIKTNFNYLKFQKPKYDVEDDDETYTYKELLNGNLEQAWNLGEINYLTNEEFLNLIYNGYITQGRDEYPDIDENIIEKLIIGGN